MAARNRRQNTSQRSSPRGQDSPLQVKEEINQLDNMVSMGQMSLDVLAQVATETLEMEPTTSSPVKKLTKRSVQSLDLLTLEQIRMLSDKALVNMFAEMTSNEMTRNYTFTCFLIPRECKETFTSFGNESRARMRVRSHLLGHIGELLKESSKGDNNARFNAEPLPARRKRLAAEHSAQKKLTSKWAKQRKAQGTKSGKSFSSNKKSAGDSFTAMKSSRSGGESASEKSNRRPVRKAAEGSLGTWADHNSSDSSPESTETSSKKTNRKSGPNYVGRNAKLRVGLARRSEEATASAPVVDMEEDHLLAPVHDEPNTTTPATPLEPQVPAERHLEENEQLIIDLLSRTQPYMDHNYTTIFGKRAMHPNYLIDLEMSDLDEEDKAARSSAKRMKTNPEIPGNNDPTNNTLTLKVNAGTVPNVNNVHIPIIRLARIPVAPDGTPLVSAEEVVVQENDAVEEIMRKHNVGSTNAMRPYPPMPKSELARRGKLMVPEEELSSSEDDSVEVAPKRVRETRRVVEGSAEWERKMALKCIRELRCKKKEATLLLCKICRDKSFTATATLMYHYRSHAGIKPFVCLICNTTFTRQHSLNYHMLIHNNQSRFTCKDCGRKFRHPSHFKEHLRRHTGETPFHCTDCPLRFKTRNTYKRHLKTRHGKLLTAKGIRQMAYEDYLKVRSKRKQQISSGEMISEEEDMEEEEVGEEEEEVEVSQTEALPSTSTAPDPTLSPPNKLLQFCRQVAQVS